MTSTMWTQESFLGGVASQSLGKLTSSTFSNGFMVHGYGFFFTSKRLIGISYSRITLIAYLIPFGIFLIWLAILLPVVAWGVQNDPNGFALPLPVYVLGPPLLGLPTLVAAFVLYLSPRRVRTKIDQQTPTSTQDLFSIRPDIALDRSDFGEISPQKLASEMSRPAAICDLSRVLEASNVERAGLFYTSIGRGNSGT